MPQEPQPLTFEEHRDYMHAVVRLKLWFLWHWLRTHPDDTPESALRERVDIYRKTDLNDEPASPRVRHYDDPRWLTLESATRALWLATRHDADAERFESLAWAQFQPTVDARAPRDYAQAHRALDGFQAGSLKFDPPQAATPDRVMFHIANAIQPRSFLCEPGYLIGCLRRLMDLSEITYGSCELTTFTWLNSYPRWLAFFPDEWQDNMSPEELTVRGHLGFWGQFLTAQGAFHLRRARQLRESGCLPYYPRRSTCSFEALRRHLDQLERL